MDDRKFDALTRSLARGASRRTALKGLFAGVIGGAAITTRLDNAGAQDACGGCPGERPICCPEIEGGTCTTSCCSDAQCGGDFCLFIGGDPHNSVCVECVSDGQCGQPDACTVLGCVDNVCVVVEGGCPAGETCCDVDGVGIDCVNLSGGDIYCGACGVTCSDCETCQGGICVSTCLQPDACTVTSCIGGECVITEGGCPAGETCCDVEGVGIDCVNLNAPGDQYCGACGVVCGPCETCNNGTCVSTCTGCQVCDSGTCIEDCGECEVCDSGTCIPTECCYDSDCPDCYFCSDEGICVENLCLLGEECCNGECVPDGECCRGFGDYCGVLEITLADDSPQLDCCDGLVCCENWNSQGSVCAECCNNWDCPKGAICHEGRCEWPEAECDYDHDCPKGTCCCKDGSCSSKCCHHPHPPKPPKPPKPAPPAPAPVTSLPATGAGPNDERNGLYGAAALGAAAAFMAAKKMRETPGEGSSQK